MINDLNQPIYFLAIFFAVTLASPLVIPNLLRTATTNVSTKSQTNLNSPFTDYLVSLNGYIVKRVKMLRMNSRTLGKKPGSEGCFGS